MSTLKQLLRANTELARRMVEENKMLRANAKTLNLAGRVITAETKRSGNYYGYVSQSGPDVTVTINLLELDGFRDHRLTGTLIRIEKRLGVEFNASKDFAAMLTREYIAIRPLEAGVTLRVVVKAAVRGDSPTCQRVETGKRTIEVVDYKIVCGEVA